MSWPDELLGLLKSAESCRLQIDGLRGQYTIAVGELEESKSGNSFEVIAKLRPQNRAINVVEEKNSSIVSQMRFSFAFNTFQAFEPQVEVFKTFISLQASAAVRHRKEVPPADRSQTKISRPVTKVERAKYQAGHLRSLASRFDPSKLRRFSRLSIVRRKAIGTIKDILALTLAPDSPGHVLVTATDLNSEAGGHRMLHSLGIAVVNLISRLEAHHMRRAILTEAFRELFLARPNLNDLAPQLIPVFHHLSIPCWAVLCLPSAFLKVGEANGWIIYFTWIPFREFLKSRSSEIEWQEGRLFCDGSIVELALSNDALRTVEARVIEIFDSALRIADLGDRRAYLGVVSDAFSQIEEWDHAAGRHLEAQRLAEARLAWMRDAEIGFDPRAS